MHSITLSRAVLCALLAVLAACGGASEDSASNAAASSDATSSGASSSTSSSNVGKAVIALSSASYSVATKSTVALITVNRVGSASGTVTVDYTTVNGTATSGAEYLPTSGSLVWTDGNTAPQTISIPVFSNIAHASSFGVSLTSVTGDADFGTPTTASVVISASTSSSSSSGVSSSGASTAPQTGLSLTCPTATAMVQFAACPGGKLVYAVPAAGVYVESSTIATTDVPAYSSAMHVFQPYQNAVEVVICTTSQTPGLAVTYSTDPCTLSHAVVVGPAAGGSLSGGGGGSPSGSSSGSSSSGGKSTGSSSSGSSSSGAGKSSASSSSSGGGSSGSSNSSGHTIPGTPTDATLISTYPAANYSGYSATTSDLGPEQSDGVRWLILNPPIPPAAAALGYTKLIYATHPIVSDVNLLGRSASGQHNFVNGQPGVNYGDSSSYFSMTDGQLTLAGGPAAPSIMAAATNDNGVAFADMNSALPFLPASSGYYIESATTCSTNVNDHWASFWMWTAEAMSDSYSSPWVEFDINEWGFDYAPKGDSTGATSFGVTSTLNHWASLHTNTKYETYSPANLLMTDEQVIGGAWNPTASTPNVEQWVNGTKTGTINFSQVNMPTNAWQGLHHFPIFGAGSHGYVSPGADYKYQVRYLMAWGPP